jgi:hypothetical protein
MAAATDELPPWKARNEPDRKKMEAWLNRLLDEDL